MEDIKKSSEDLASLEDTTEEIETAAASTKEDKAWDEMTKKIKAYNNELKEAKAELKKLKAIEADYQESNARLMEYEAQFKQSQISTELKTFAKDFNIPEPVLAKELENYKDEAIYKNAGNLKKLLLSESFEVFEPYIKGTSAPQQQTTNIPIINGGGGAIAQPTNSINDLAKAFVENKNQSMLTQIFKK